MVCRFKMQTMQAICILALQPVSCFVKVWGWEILWLEERLRDFRKTEVARFCGLRGCENLYLYFINKTKQNR